MLLSGALRRSASIGASLSPSLMFSAGVNGDSAYMTSGVLMPGALDGRVATLIE